ncbi:lysozyme inhibitor LprI family protein [Aliivibrio fischeri]|uniref:lysozyme inhibitor LprI family protein n=1 Tax=Aliivibrio fischeri TaxID=668 RepID=UPI0018C7FC89|nr:lysozyme inhibitor LprI family protein [Aliivibrio fischeri]
MLSNLKIILSWGVPIIFLNTAFAYQADDFSENYNEKLTKRIEEYKKNDLKLNLLYKEIRSGLIFKNLDHDFKSSQIQWIKYKEQACSAKEYFPNTEVSNDVMTQYLIAECNSWVTQARIIEFNFIRNKSVELAYLKTKNVQKPPTEQYLNSWKEYVKSNCALNKKLHNDSITSCTSRLNLYYKELVL